MISARVAVSGILALTSLTVASLYFAAFMGTPQLVRRPLPPGQESLVVMIEQAGPVWPVLFGLAFAAIVAALLRPTRQSVIWSHIAGFFAWLFYGSAILVGAVMQVPPVPVIHGSLSLFVAFLHLVMPLVWLQSAPCTASALLTTIEPDLDVDPDCEVSP